MNNRSPKTRKIQITRRLKDYQWSIVGMLVLFAVILGYIGYQKYFASIDQTRTTWDLFYYTLRLFALEFNAKGALPWELEVARFLAPAAIVYTAVKAIFVIFHEQLQLFRIRFARNHVVICGLGKKGQLLAKAFCERGYQVVCIELNKGSTVIEQCRRQGAIVLTGNAAERELLRKARINKAKYLFSVCDDNGVNTDIAVYARAMVKDRKRGVLSCFIHISELELVLLLREKEIETQQSDAIRLNFFNIYDSGARALLQAYPIFNDGEVEGSQLPHILLVGLGQLGESLLLRSARLWNISHRGDGKKLTITVIDCNAKEKIARLLAQHPPLSRVCELDVHDMSIHSAEFQKGNFLRGSDDSCIITKIYICLDDDSKGLSAALKLRQHLKGSLIPAVICMKHDTGLAALLQGGAGREYDEIIAFGLLDQTCTPDLLLGGTHEMLARAIHEDYVKKEKEKGLTPETNPSMAPWDELQETFQASNRAQSDHIGVKLKAAGCDIRPLTDWNAELFQFTDEKEVERLAEMEHERWNEERFLDGWIYASGDKNAKKKTSPWLVDWDKLPDDIKEYDRNTIRGLPAFLAKVGFEVYRLNGD